MAGEGDTMNHETALSKAKDIADRILAPAAAQHDKEGKFSAESVAGLGEAGLLGLMLPAEVGGAGLGPRSFAAVTSTLAEADASAAMVYLMHVTRRRDDRRGSARCGGDSGIEGDRRGTTPLHPRLQRGRFAQPFLDTGLPGAPERGRLPPHGEEVLGHQRRPCPELCRLGARTGGCGADGFHSVSRPSGRAGTVGRGPLGRSWGCGPTPRRR